jgi:hypothetical protein
MINHSPFFQLMLGGTYRMLPFLPESTAIDHAINRVITQLGMNLSDLRMQ